MIRKKFPTRNEKRKPTMSSLALTEKIADLIIKAQGESELLSNYLQNHSERIAFDIDYVRQYVPLKHNILDVGASPFLLSGALLDCGYDVMALDCGPETMQDALERMNLKAIKCDVEVEKIPVSDSYFDEVIFNEVFEHLRINPIHTMREIRRILKPGGRLWLSTPNMRSLNGFYNLLIRQQSFSCSGDIYLQYENCNQLGGMGHVREYTAVEVARFLEKIGFEVEELIYRGKFRMKIKRLVAHFLPMLGPFMTIVARKRE